MRIIVLTALIAVAGCAAQPKEPDAQASGDAVAPAAAVQPAAAAQPAPDVQPAAVPASGARLALAAAEEEKPFVPPAGYKLRKDKGPDTYCTKVVVLGSRFPKEDCRTASQLRDMEAQKEAMRGEIVRRTAICSSAAGCANN